ncbi:L-gulonolactone oxidase [Pseudolycoriella hygida]|uniref:L-gulonolactone oxidase n=1 Tax=Pseudolycoriella hygida TaxID=35572 RepID=A0A9Q0MSV6_9DIPT|nr:L-gulonolactone oxidase [Pseudolycoriella hygida]
MELKDFYIRSVVIINWILLVHPLHVNIASSNDYTSFIPSTLCRALEPIRHPTHVEDVVSIVKEAIERGVAVKAFGERHSITDIICTDGIPVDMRLFKSMRMNDDKTATFGAGITVQEAGDFLLQHRQALRVYPAFGNVTLAGAIGTGAHGSSIKYHSTLSAQVAKMTVVDGRGQVKIISSVEDLRVYRIHLGLLVRFLCDSREILVWEIVKWFMFYIFFFAPPPGIIVDLTFRTVPLYKVRSEVYVESDEVLENGEAINWARTSDQLTFYWFPSIDEVAVSNMSFVAAETVGNAKILMSSSYESKCPRRNLQRKCLQLVFQRFRMLYFLEMRNRTRLAPLTKISRDGGNDAHTTVGYPHDILSSICGRSNAFACWWSHPKPFALETLQIENDFYNEASGNLAGYQTISQVLATKFKARSHWGKSGLLYHSSQMLDLKLHSFAREKFLVAMTKFDPNGVFLNSFGRRLKRSGTVIDVDPLTTRCALLDNCLCSVNADCAKHQICTTISGFGYPVCQTKNFVATTFNRSEFSDTFQVGDWYFNVFPQLIYSLKC